MKPAISMAVSLIILGGAAQAGMPEAYDAMVKKDYIRAAKELEPEAKSGNADAQYALGALYETGKGVNKDYIEALAWYQRAADAGNADAKTAHERVAERMRATPLPTSEMQRLIEDLVTTSPNIMVAPTVIKSLDQDEFMTYVGTARSMFKEGLASKNEIRQQKARTYRREKLCGLQSRSIQNWIGKVDRIIAGSAPNEGADVFINMGGDIFVETLGKDIPSSSPMFDRISQLSVGDSVIFSGELYEDQTGKDCFYEMSVTLYGSMTEPEFKFRMTSIRTR